MRFVCKGGSQIKDFNIYRDISERTGGDIYIGVVGPVRTGKSTFIKQFMDHLVLPHLQDKFLKNRARDELPQSSGGKMIMTTEPKFVPEEAVQLEMDNINFKVRMIDCVGYTVPGAIGYEDEGKPRMVSTPWYDKEIPFQEAAEVGTQKVINEHSTLGLVVTSDGSFGDIARHNFVLAEERVIKELKEIGKPFIILLNSTNPAAEETQELANTLSKKYNIAVEPVNCLEMQEADINRVLHKILYEFPIREVVINLPVWTNKLPKDHWLREGWNKTIFNSIQPINKIRDIDSLINDLADDETTRDVYLEQIQLGDGQISIAVGLLDNLYYDIIEEFTGLKAKDQGDLLELIGELSHAKREYDRISDALKSVREKGYGIVTPDLSEMEFAEPEIIKRGNRFGVKLQASSPSIHLIRADIKAEVSPVVGTEKQSEKLISFIQQDLDEDPAAIWDTEFLGRSLHDIVQEGISNKLYRMPDSAQNKLRNTIEKIVNDGSGGFICIIL